MRIECIGGGSVGLLLAARLCAAGASVNVITRSAEQAEALRTRGLTVVDRTGRTAAQTVYPQAAGFAEYAASADDAPDWILLTVKQKDIGEELLEAVSHHMGKETRLCCFQNGIGHLDKLRASGIAEGVYAAVTTEGARRTGPSEVVHTGKGTTWFGEPGNSDPCGPPPALLKLVASFQKAGFQAEMSKSIDTDIWNKLIINSVINPLTALLGVTNGSLPKSEDALLLMRKLYEEAAGLAGGLGIRTSHDLWERILAVCEATGPNRSSMLQDLEAGRRTELDWLNGSLLREADRAGMELTTHRVVYHLVRCREQNGKSDHDG